MSAVGAELAPFSFDLARYEAANDLQVDAVILWAEGGGTGEALSALLATLERDFRLAQASAAPSAQVYVRR